MRNFAKKQIMATDYNNGYSGLAIADYFIKKCLDAKIPVTNMAILKMLYFAHGLAYPQLGFKLIKDPFYKWPWGPVEVHTYEEFKKYGSRPIKSVSGKTDIEQIKRSPEITAFLDSLIPLAKLSPFILSEKSHVKGGPWDVARFFDVIDNKTIETFFYGRYAK